jgi:DNA-binding GntR family transcriptional regulator
MSLPEPFPTTRLICDHGLRRQTIVASLLADVFAGRLRAGQHLITQELATRFGVSHTPIREALIAIAGLGVVDLQPNRGAVVRRVTSRDVTEVCHVRRLLECEAVRLACGRIDSDELQSLTDGLTRQNQHRLDTGSGVAGAEHRRFIEEARALDSRLHDVIAASCGNAFLVHELSRLKTLFRAFRDVSWEHDEARNDYHRLAVESREHLAIVAALAAGDGAAASRAMSRHIMAGAASWGQVFVESPGGSHSTAAGNGAGLLEGLRPNRRGGRRLAAANDLPRTDPQSRTR